MTDKPNFKIPAVMSYSPIAICLSPVVFGIPDLAFGSMEDGLLDIVIGSSFISKGINFDYAKTKGWAPRHVSYLLSYINSFYLDTCMYNFYQIKLAYDLP